jgi:serpin B
VIRFLKIGSFTLALVVLCQFFITVPVRAEVAYGDLNGDGGIDAIDFAYLRDYLLRGRIPPATDWEKNADLYKDGEVDSLDFAIFRQYILGMVPGLPFNPGQTGNQTVTPTPMIQGDWAQFIPQPENVALNLVIENSPETNYKNQKYIQVTITFNTGGYRIADEGKLMSSISESGEVNLYTSGVQIEKYVGNGGVTQALTYRKIKYPIDNQLADKVYFDFRVYDRSVTGFAFKGNSIVAPTPIPYEATVNEKFIDANSQFAANLFKEINEDDLDKNVFFSPFSLSMALSMVYQGADATTKEAMGRVLNYSELTTEEINQSYREHLNYFKRLYPEVELNVANSIWTREGFEVNQSFLDTNKEVFDSQNSYLDFSKTDACDVMNEWISDATKGKIEKMINPPIDPDMIMYLINAIYFNGSWMDQFDVTQTRDSAFTNIKGESKIVPMMSKNDNYKYAETSEYRAVELPYGSGSVSMYCILPEAGNLNDFIAEFDNTKWKEIKGKLSMGSKIVLKLPRFKIDYQPKDLKDKLTALGMAEAFSKNADFSKIADKIWISDIGHKAVIDVNEKGTEAAAVTYIGMGTTSMPNSFIADKPFMFVIADNATGTVLFMGKVVDF